MAKSYNASEIQDLVADGQASEFLQKLLAVAMMEEGELLGYLEGAEKLRTVTKGDQIVAFRVEGEDVETGEKFDITQPEGASVGGRRRRTRRSTRVTKRRKVLSRRRRLHRR